MPGAQQLSRALPQSPDDHHGETRAHTLLYTTRRMHSPSTNPQQGQTAPARACGGTLRYIAVHCNTARMRGGGPSAHHGQDGEEGGEGAVPHGASDLRQGLVRALLPRAHGRQEGAHDVRRVVDADADGQQQHDAGDAVEGQAWGRGGGGEQRGGRGVCVGGWVGGGGRRRQGELTQLALLAGMCAPLCAACVWAVGWAMRANGGGGPRALCWFGRPVTPVAAAKTAVALLLTKVVHAAEHAHVGKDHHEQHGARGEEVAEQDEHDHKDGRGRDDDVVHRVGNDHPEAVVKGEGLRGRGSHGGGLRRREGGREGGGKGRGGRVRQGRLASWEGEGEGGDSGNGSTRTAGRPGLPRQEAAGRRRARGAEPWRTRAAAYALHSHSCCKAGGRMPASQPWSGGPLGGGCDAHAPKRACPPTHHSLACTTTYTRRL